MRCHDRRFRIRGARLREGVNEPDSPEAERRARPPMRGDLRRLHVIYGGIDTSRFRPADAAGKRQQWGLAPEHYAFAVAAGMTCPGARASGSFCGPPRSSMKRLLWRASHRGRGSMAERLRADIAQLGLTGKAWLTDYEPDMRR